MTHDQIKPILALCREHGVRSIKLNGLEVLFDPVEPFGVPEQLGNVPGFSANGKIPTEEEFLFAAVDYDPSANKDQPALKEEG